MPTIKLDKKVLEKSIKKKLSLEKLKERISYLGTDLESIKGNEITVEVFPNRPDMLSEQGFARAFSSFINAKSGLRQYKLKNSNEKVIIENSVKSVRPYTACAIVKNLKLDHEKIKEIINIQEKLHITYGRNRRKVAIGIYPLEKIKMPIYYKAKDPKEIKFRPLDSKKVMNSREILANHPAGREYGYLLEKESKFPIFVDSNNEIMSMPPIINSEKTGKVTARTKEVFIECSGFDFNVLSKCLNIIVTAFSDIGGDVYTLNLKYGGKTKITPNLNPEKIKLDIKYVNRLLGLNLNESKIKNLLAKMGYGYRNKTVLIPAYRTDVLHEIDLVEDIAIAYGYENFKPEIPKVATIAEEDKFEVFKNKIADLLVGVNLTEVNTYHITNKNDLVDKMDLNLDCIELKNALTSEYNVLRSWLTPSLLKVLADNRHNDYPQNIFEIATVFKKDNKEETNVKEFSRLAILLCNQKANYTLIRQILDVIFDNLDLKYEIKETDHNSFITGRVARISYNKKDIAYIGEIKPSVITNFGIEMPIAALELNLTELYNLLE